MARNPETIARIQKSIESLVPTNPSPVTTPPTAPAYNMRSKIIGHLHDLWVSARTAKSDAQKRIISNLYQIRGEYEPQKLAEIKAVGGSEAFLQVTKSKFLITIAWLKDILEQPGEPGWSLDPTPMPEIPSSLEESITREFMARCIQELGTAISQAPPGTADISNMAQSLAASMDALRLQMPDIILKKTKERAQKMMRKMDDQLIEGGWYEARSQCLHDLVAHTCFLKGPIDRMEVFKNVTVNDANNTLGVTIGRRIRPTWERRSPLCIYPAPDAVDIQDGYLFDFTPLEIKDLESLIGVPGYDEVALREIISSYKTKGWTPWTGIDWWMQRLNDPTAVSYTHGRKIDALEFWGPIHGTMLLDWGMDPSLVPDPDMFYQSKILWIDRWIVSAILNPDPLGERPYFKCSFIENPDSFWGEGEPELFWDLQMIINAITRAIQNNIALASGPQVVVNLSRIDSSQDFQLRPWKYWLFTDSQMLSGAKPVEFYQPDMNAQYLSNVLLTFLRICDEHSMIPSYAHGSGQVGGAGNTVGGLTILYQSSSRGIKSVIKNIDQKLTAPSVKSQYYYNIKEGESADWFVDMVVVGKGSESLMIKEQQAVRRMEFMQYTANPFDMQIMGQEGRRELLRQTGGQSLGLDMDKIIPARQAMIPPMPSLAPIVPAGPGAAPPASPRTVDQAGLIAGGAENRIMTNTTGGPA